MSIEIDALHARWSAALSHRGACPGCASDRVWHDGRGDRKASLLFGRRVDFVGDVARRRLRCRDCRGRWIHRPDRVTSRAHYQPCVVAHAIAATKQTPAASMTAIARAYGCHRRTLGRWIARVAKLAEPAALAAALIAEVETPVLPAIPTEVERPRVSARTVAQTLRALTILALLEALASFRGLEPPALAHADALLSTLVVSPASIPANAPTPRSRGDPRSFS